MTVQSDPRAGASGRSLAPLAAGAGQTTVRVALIGGFTLRVDDQPVELPLSAQRLVAFLALHPGRLRRPFVAGSLWIDISEQRAHACLRTAVWRCSRPTLDLLTPTATHVGLNPGVAVDVHELSTLAERELDGHSVGDAPGRDPEPHRARDHDGAREVALSADGELLPDWYEDWIEFKREGLRQQRLHALEARSHRLREQGRYAEALQAGLAAVATDPLRESAHRALIATHLAEGNVAEAVRQYRRFAARLQADLGLTPTPRLTSLLDAADVTHLQNALPGRHATHAGRVTRKRTRW
jgi:DNA-binding SARP family transcriptional activator